MPPLAVLADGWRWRLGDLLALQLVLFSELVLIVLEKSLVSRSNVHETLVIFDWVTEDIPRNGLIKVLLLRLERTLPLLLVVHDQHILDTGLGLRGPFPSETLQLVFVRVAADLLLEAFDRVSALVEGHFVEVLVIVAAGYVLVEWHVHVVLRWFHVRDFVG